MRSLRILGLFLCVLALASLAAAAGENLGIRDTYRNPRSLRRFTSDRTYFPQGATKSGTLW